MKTNVEQLGGNTPLNVLLIGNNPLDMSNTLDKIHQLRGRKVITETAFDLKSIVERLMKFHPHFILIDDNIGKVEMAQTMEALSRSNRTKNVPITILKNSNYHEASTTSTVLDYILKKNFSPESLYIAIRNSLKFKRTQEYLYKAYKKRKGQLLGRLAFS
jgi:DNA-binding NarL/FixJ family response regulator